MFTILALKLSPCTGGSVMRGTNGCSGARFADFPLTVPEKLAGSAGVADCASTDTSAAPVATVSFTGQGVAAAVSRNRAIDPVSPFAVN